MIEARNGQPTIFLATPCYGGQANIGYVRSLLELQTACAERGVGLHIEFAGDSLISRIRSILAGQFLAHPTATHLLFVDADISFQSDQIFRLLDSAHDVVGGVCPAKNLNWHKVREAANVGHHDLMAAGLSYVVRFKPSPNNAVELDEAGFGEVDYVGTGFVCVSRSAVQRLTDAHPELRAKLGDLGRSKLPEATMLYECMIEPETGQHLSEDYAFCRRWKDLGGRIYADFTGRFIHSGVMDYVGGLMDGNYRRPQS
jgi:hypothetical protein